MSQEIEVVASIARIHVVQAGSGFTILLFGSDGGVAMRIKTSPITKDGIRVHLDDAALDAAGVEVEDN